MTGIPTIATYRGIGIHDHQSRARIKVVKAAIDRVTRMSGLTELVDFAADVQEPPEARMFAASKVEAAHSLAADDRRNRPAIDLDWLRAVVAGLDSINWRSPWVYGTLLDHDGVPREQPLADDEGLARFDG